MVSHIGVSNGCGCQTAAAALMVAGERVRRRTSALVVVSATESGARVQQAGASVARALERWTRRPGAV